MTERKKIIAVIGAGYGTLFEIARALQSGIPVIGLNTCAISRNGRRDTSIITAKDPADAVNRALGSTGD